MLTPNQTVLTDNKSILVFKIDLEADGFMYFSDTIDKITLDGIDFDGKVIFKNSISEIREYIDVSLGGGIGSVGNFSFSIARYNSYSGASNFHEDFYPADGKPLLTSKTVDVGIVWEGATTLAEITWLKSYFIQDHSWTNDSLDLTCIEFDELAATELPYYRIQDEIENEISYYTDIDDETRGKVLPLVYGEYNTINREYSEFSLAPAIRANKGFQFILASHLCHTVDSTTGLYQYIEDANALLRIYGAGITSVNKWNLHYTELATGRYNNLYAELIIQPKFIATDYVFSAPLDASNAGNMMDGGATSYMLLQPNETVALVLPANLPTNLFGETDGSLASVSMNVKWASNTANQAGIRLKFFHPELEIESQAVQNDTTTTDKDTAFQFGDGTTVIAKKDTSNANWNIDELQKLYYCIQNTGTQAVKIYNVYLKFNQFKYFEVLSKQSFRRNQGERLRTFKEMPLADYSKNTKDLLGAVKGYTYDGWIDTGRSNGHSTGDLIESPAYVLEGLLRDEVKTERNLEILGKTDSVTYAISGLKSAINDYYNGAIIVNTTVGERATISDYVGSSGTIILSSAPSSTWNAGDLCYIKNINISVDTSAFDIVGSAMVESGTTTATSPFKLIESGQNFLSTVTPGMLVRNIGDGSTAIVLSVDSNTQLTLTNHVVPNGESYQIWGARGDWEFARSLTSRADSRTIINQILYEMDCILAKSFRTYRLVPLDGGPIKGTLTTPLLGPDRSPMVFTQLTPLANLYSEFTLNYAYDYAKGIYTRRHHVSKNSNTHKDLADLQINCSDVETKYKVQRTWEYNADWITDVNTAAWFLRNKILWLTSQRMEVRWTGDVANHIHYEVGDYVKINYDKIMPYGKNNDAYFLVVGKSVKKKAVQLTLFS